MLTMVALTTFAPRLDYVSPFPLSTSEKFEERFSGRCSGRRLLLSSAMYLDMQQVMRAWRASLMHASMWMYRRPPRSRCCSVQVESERSKTIQQFLKASRSLSSGQHSDSSMPTHNGLRLACLFVVLKAHRDVMTDRWHRREELDFIQCRFVANLCLLVHVRDKFCSVTECLLLFSGAYI